MKRYKSGLSVACLAGLAAIAGPALADAVDLAEIRAATAKYSDVEVALAEGFIPDPSGACVSAAAEGLPPELGGMGIHYLHPGMLGLAPPGGRVSGNGMVTDFTTPTILLYEPQPDGSLVLVGVENLVFKAAWEAAGNTAPPKFAGHDWDSMADMMDTDGDEAHGFEPHYDLHVWAQRENPSGALSAFNPAVRCP